MEFHIQKDRSWLETQFELMQEDASGVASELEHLAHSKKDNAYSDSYITLNKLKARGHSHFVRPVTAKLIKRFLREHIHRYPIHLLDAQGHILEKTTFYDNNNGIFDNQTIQKRKLTYKTDLFIREIPNQTAENITNEVLQIANYTLLQFFYFNPTTKNFILKNKPIDFHALYERFKNFKSPTPPEIEMSSAKKQAWQDLHLTNQLNYSTLLALYRLYRMSYYQSIGLIQDNIAFSDLIDFGELRGITDTLPQHQAPSLSLKKHEKTNQLSKKLEESLTTNLLVTLLVDLKKNLPKNKTFSDQLSLIVIHATHIINTTGGRQGIAVFEHLSEFEWQSLLDDADTALAIITTLAQAIKKEADSSSVRGPLANYFLNILSTTHKTYNNWFKSIVAMAFLMGMKDHPHFFIDLIVQLQKDNLPETEVIQTVSDIIFNHLNLLHELKDHDTNYPHHVLVDIVLSTFGELANSKEVSPSIKNQAFEWCKTFYLKFETFLNTTHSQEQQVLDKTNDRLMILKCQYVMSCLNPEQAESFFFHQLIKPLDTNFDPRIEKFKAHNSYYRRIGEAQNLALLHGFRSLAFKRRLDQENNEWGRVAEKIIRENDIFRLEFFKEAHADIKNEGDSSIQAVLNSFDKSGLLNKNLAFLHILRYLYFNRFPFDPTQQHSAPENAAFIDSLNLTYMIQYPIDATLYEKYAVDFDAWLLHIEENNPDFINQLKDTYLKLPFVSRSLPIEVIFMEINEAEVFHYYIDPDKAPMAVLDFVGGIRSWTSGYQGRTLTRLQPYFDQLKIIKDKEQNPQTYTPPEEYYKNYSYSMSYERFEKVVLPLLKEAEAPTGNLQLYLSTEEATQLLKYFDETIFSAYLPEWLFAMIDYPFQNEKDHFNIQPALMAFDLLSKTKFPKEEMERVFAKRGYLLPANSFPLEQQARQELIYKAAMRCLKKLPNSKPHKITYEEKHSVLIRKKINRAGRNINELLPAPYAKLKKEFTKDTPLKPEEYFDYRKQSRQLLSSKRMEAIKIILEEALQDKELVFPPNAPLRPLLKGLPGLVVSEKQLNEALYKIATTSSSSRKGLASLLNFSAILVQWGERNHIDLTQVFTDAFTNYKVPPHIQNLQTQIIELDKKIRALQREIEQLQNKNSFSSPKKSELLKLKKQKEKLEQQRNLEIVKLSEDPNLKSKQAIFQMITYVYNEIRRQYLKEVLISGGAYTGRMIESYLEDVLIPYKQRLLNQNVTDFRNWLLKIDRVNQKIEFLMDVLSQMENRAIQ